MFIFGAAAANELILGGRIKILHSPCDSSMRFQECIVKQQELEFWSQTTQIYTLAPLHLILCLQLSAWYGQPFIFLSIVEKLVTVLGGIGKDETKSFLKLFFAWLSNLSFFCICLEMHIQRDFRKYRTINSFFSKCPLCPMMPNWLVIKTPKREHMLQAPALSWPWCEFDLTVNINDRCIWCTYSRRAAFLEWKLPNGQN